MLAGPAMQFTNGREAEAFMNFGHLVQRCHVDQAMAPAEILTQRLEQLPRYWVKRDDVDFATALAEKMPPEAMLKIIQPLSLRNRLSSEILRELSRADFLNGDTHTLKAALDASPILRLIELPYKRVYFPALEERIDYGHVAGLTIEEESWKFYEALEEICAYDGGINSSLRNLLIAARIARNHPVTDSSPIYVTLAEYTWPEHFARTSVFGCPTLAEQGEHARYCKIVLAYPEERGRYVYADYGTGFDHPEYGKRPTGEGRANVAGSIVPDPPVPLQMHRPVRKWALAPVTDSQKRASENRNQFRMGQQAKMIRHLADFSLTPEGYKFPSILSSVDDLSATQIQSVLQWSRLVEERVDESIVLTSPQDIALPRDEFFTPFHGSCIRIESSAPSTRTVTAASAAGYGFGMVVDEAYLTSRGKNETPLSEAVTLHSHGVDIVLRRSKLFESEARELQEKGDTIPLLISLGGNDHHPTQTLAELKAIMEDFGIHDYDIEKLRQATDENPPTMVFIGHLEHKRADKALIQTIQRLFPKWKIRAYVPEDQHVPTFSTELNSNYSCEVVDDLDDPAMVSTLVDGAYSVYVANPAETSNTTSSSEAAPEVPPADYHLSAQVLHWHNHLKVFAPLPASEELDPQIFSMDGNSQIIKVMKNKVFVMNALMGHMLIGKQRRLTIANHVN